MVTQLPHTIGMYHLVPLAADGEARSHTLQGGSSFESRSGGRNPSMALDGRMVEASSAGHHCI